MTAELGRLPKPYKRQIPKKPEGLDSNPDARIIKRDNSS